MLKSQPGVDSDPAGSNDPSIEVYGTKWCASTQMVRRYLDRLGLPYTYRDMDLDQRAARQVQWWTGGYLSHPVVQAGGNVLVEPSLSDLTRLLRQLDLM